MINASVSFCILMIVTIICLIVLTVFVCRLIISITNLSNNANTIATSIQTEIEPTLKELKEAAKSINSIANNADEKFKDARANVSSILGATSCIGGKIKTFSQGILKGISFGLKLFKK